MNPEVWLKLLDELLEDELLEGEPELLLEELELPLDELAGTGAGAELEAAGVPHSQQQSSITVAGYGG